MLYDRPYMKASEPESRKMGILAWLIVSEIVVFMMQNLVWVFFDKQVYSQAILDVFALSGAAVSEGKVWTLFTYAFLHDTNNILHLLFNMLGLFFIGRIVTRIFGEKVLVETFLISTLTGALLYLLVHLNGGPGYVLGASGALMGVIALFCMARPEEEVTLLLYFIIPVNLKPKWILWGLTGISVLGVIFRELPGSDHTAHSAHLGGLLGGFLYYKLLSRGKTLRGIAPKIHFKSTTATPPPRSKVKKMGYSVNFSNKEKLKKEVDRILDKINAQGFGALTVDERKTLDKARDILKD